MKSNLITQPLLIIILFQILYFTTVQTYNFPIIRCEKTTTNTIYQTNIKTALALVSTAVTTHYGYNKTYVGEGQNKITAVAICRGDVGLETCKICISKTVVQLQQNCTNMIEAVVWNENCSLLYSSRTNVTTTSFDQPNANSSTHVTTSDAVNFGATLRSLMTRLTEKAASGNSLRKFATGDDVVVGSEKIYAMMQYSPAMSSTDCTSCLSILFKEAQECCDGYIDVIVFFRGCQLRYSNVSFYYDPPAISLPANSTSPTSYQAIPGGKRNPSKIMKVIIIVASVSIGLVLISIGLWCLVIKSRLKNRDTYHQSSANSTLMMISDSCDHFTQNGSVEMQMELGTGGSLKFDLGTIIGATKNFFIENKIGEGGFGPVYKGVLSNGTEVAVKRLSKTSGQGSREFVNEVILMAKLQHRNLVRLLGFFLEDDEKLLIYEYVSNKSLDYFLFDPNMHEHLDWPKRYSIIEGITKGMLYLHQDSRLRIIHRDLKASNILLDFDMNAKISDFGLARIVGADQIQGNTNRIVGTYGYMSPEYAVHGHFSVKSDVFAFGVVVLEIITGKKSSSFLHQDDLDDLPHFAWRNWNDGTKMELVDQTMVETCSKDEVMRCINIALLCVQEDLDDRPSMASILNMLNNYSIPLSSPKKPPHYIKKNSTYFSTIKSDFFNSKEESSITGVHPR
ncbi:cysteine-rich receptor-like protein kinase 15 [Bidens hawaiensis]|uniref:cysteine-rich receptor-like protein kinase 15 n=1 Tax=Bidens hawaiensis TaxID=980011 RepID=UPI00404B4225